jgi:serine/threonine protein kinase
MVYVGRGVGDPPRVLEQSLQRKGDPTEVHLVPPEAEAAVLLCYADFLEVACFVLKAFKRHRVQCPLVAVVLRPAHGVFLAKLSSVATTLRKGGADTVIMQPRDKLDLQERLQSVLGLIDVRWEHEKKLIDEPALRANSLFFEIIDQIIEGFPRISSTMEERAATPKSLGGVGQYSFTSLLGEGKFGKVFTTVPSGRPDAPPEAVKVIPKRSIATAKHCNQVLKECRLLQKVRHANVAEFRGLVHGVWNVYIFMEFVGVTDLSTYIQSGQNARLESACVLELLLQISDAVAYCHQMLVAHRDIKSENVVITADSIPKLVDFGLAVQLSNSAVPELCTDKCGTIPFAPPEVYRGKHFEASAMDVWSLGILTLEMRYGNNSVCRMLGCTNHPAPNEELADTVEKFFSRPDWHQIVQKMHAGVGQAEGLLVVLRNTLLVQPEMRWPAAELFRHIANSAGPERHTPKKDGTAKEDRCTLEHAEYCTDLRSPDNDLMFLNNDLDVSFAGDWPGVPSAHRRCVSDDIRKVQSSSDSQPASPKGPHPRRPNPRLPAVRGPGGNPGAHAAQSRSSGGN